jgi:drug/metabolite transporter (DMT)-like permease
MACIYLVWGSTYLAIRVSVRTIPPLMGCGVRFLAAGIVLFGVLGALGRLRPFPSRAEVWGASVVGCWLLVGAVGMITVCEQHIPSNIAAVIASTAAIWVVIYRRLNGERVPPKALAAVLAGFIGVAVLLAPSVGGGGLPLGWLAIALVVPFNWSSGSFYGARYYRMPDDAFVASAIEMTAAGLVLLAASLLAGERLGAVSAESVVAVVYLMLASLIAFSAYVWLLGKLPISTVVTHQYVNPVVAVILGAALLSEPVTWSVILGAGLIIGAVVMIVRDQSPPAVGDQR